MRLMPTAFFAFFKRMVQPQTSTISWIGAKNIVGVYHGQGIDKRAGETNTTWGGGIS